jgi:hypothetical protein
VTESKFPDKRALFGKRLREIRISRGFSQETLAFEALGGHPKAAIYGHLKTGH